MAASMMPRAKAVFFEGCGHWLYVERPAEFGALVAAFAKDGLAGVEGVECVE